MARLAMAPTHGDFRETDLWDSHNREAGEAGGLGMAWHRSTATPITSTHKGLSRLVSQG
jgi:hypothetical protein